MDSSFKERKQNAIDSVGVNLSRRKKKVLEINLRRRKKKALEALNLRRRKKASFAELQKFVPFTAHMM